MEQIIIPKSVWLNSQLSVARFYGGINIQGKEFLIVPQTEDLVRHDWIGVYKKVGREKTLEFVRSGKTLSDARKEIKACKLSEDEKKRVRENENKQNGDLFSNL